MSDQNQAMDGLSLTAQTRYNKLLQIRPSMAERFKRHMIAVGRPTKYNDQMSEIGCFIFAQGGTVANAASHMAIVPKTYYNWVSLDHPEFLHMDNQREVMQADFFDEMKRLAIHDKDINLIALNALQATCNRLNFKDFCRDNDPVARSEMILDAAAESLLTPKQAQQMITSIKDCQYIASFDTLLDRVDALEMVQRG